METAKKVSIGAIALAVIIILSLVAFLGFKGQKKKQDETAIVAAVTDSTALLRETLATQPPGDAVARLDAHLARIKASEHTPLVDAAEDYVLGAREIARRRAEAARLAPQPAAARQALLAHLAAGGRRSDAWFKHAGDLKKRVEDAHYAYGVPLKTLDSLLDGMQESRKRVGALVGEKVVIPSEALSAARQQVQEELKRSASELERARQIPI